MIFRIPKVKINPHKALLSKTGICPNKPGKMLPSFGPNKRNGDPRIFDNVINIVPRSGVGSPVLKVLIEIENPKIIVPTVAAYQTMVINMKTVSHRRFIYSANVRDHRHLAVARPMAVSDSEQASSVPRVGVRWIALLGSILSSRNPTVYAERVVLKMCIEDISKDHPAHKLVSSEKRRHRTRLQLKRPLKHS